MEKDRLFDEDKVRELLADMGVKALGSSARQELLDFIDQAVLRGMHKSDEIIARHTEALEAIQQLCEEESKMGGSIERRSLMPIALMAYCALKNIKPAEAEQKLREI